MKVTIPLFVERSDDEYHVRPLFEPALLHERSPLLQRCQTKAQAKLRQLVDRLKGEGRTDALRALLFAPELREHKLDLRFLHRKATCRTRLFVVTFEAFERRLAWSPQLGLWFEWPAGSALEDHAAEVLKHHLKKGEEKPLLPDTEQAWVESFSFETTAPGVVAPPKPPSLLAFLGMRETGSGAQELAQVGRQLDLAPAETLLGRAAELEELSRLLVEEPRAAVAVVGARQVGKSALIRAFVRQAGKKKKSKHVQHWLLTPGRLIAGMSHVGQWESRLVAILKHMRARNHVLVFDDLIGLLTAGHSADAQLSVAQVLKSFLDRQELRVLAEITPTAWQVLRQRDAAFADLFQVVRLDETDPPTTARIALTAARQAFDGQGADFSLNAVQTVLEISRRYLTDASFPGKAAAQIHQLAARFRKQGVDREAVLRWFSQRSGLHQDFLDDRTALDLDAARAFLDKRILGQPEAVDVCLEVLCLARARLREPGKPLSGLLFVGPTGVGKTETAKAFAELLFGSPERLVRFDMNEYLGEDALARLVGDWRQPGQLTQALRRQPFCVLLLDEIEKAHPRVLNLLLQILGDARLTDSGGRTADFSQALVILTSNLGARAAQSTLGVRSRTHERELVYRRAVEEFFPPELFNRLDRVVAFRPLERQSVALLARRELDKLLLRGGLARRQCLLEVDPEAMEEVIEAGFHPTLGARALKRQVETSVTAAVARRLSALPPDVPTRIHIRAGLQVSVDRLGLRPLGPQPWLEPDLTARVARLHEEWTAELKGRESAALVSQDELDEGRLHYYELQDDLRRLGAALRGLGKPAPKGANRPLCWGFPPERMRALAASPDLASAYQGLLADLPGERERFALSERVALVGQAAWIRARWQPGVEKVDLAARGPEEPTKRLRALYAKLETEGHGARALLGPEEGLHLFLTPQGLELVQVGAPQGGEIVRLYTQSQGMLDLATGLWSPNDHALALMLRARLPL